MLFQFAVRPETAAQEGNKVVEIMLGVGLVFVCVIALGELTPLDRETAPPRPARRRLDAG